MVLSERKLKIKIIGAKKMDRRYLISPEGNFYKAQLHTHSTVSDGSLTPEEVKEAYKKHGYSVVAFTDHSRLVQHNDLTDDSFLAINAYEFEVNHGMLGGSERCYHLNFYAKTPEIYRQVFFDPKMASWCYSKEELAEFNYVGEPVQSEYSVEFINKAIKAANENGFMVCYNHPAWSMQLEEDFVGLEGLFAFEIYNHGSEIMEANGYAPHNYTSMLRAGKLPACIASDDSHSKRTRDENSPYYDINGGYVMVKAKELSYGAIIDALERRDFYASTGVEIEELYIEDNRVHIKTSPCRQITLIGDRRCNRVARSAACDLTEATLDISPKCGSFWILCEDDRGHFAATSAAEARV